MDILQLPFVGTFELRKNLPSLLKQLDRGGKEVVLTQKGKPTAMLLSIKKYLKLKALNEELEEAIRELADTKNLKELVAASEEIKSGKGKKAKDVFRQLGV